MIILGFNLIPLDFFLPIDYITYHIVHKVNYCKI